MKYLFLLAHPDDEAVAAGGTIRRLVDEGDEVVVILATKGEGGLVQGKKVKDIVEVRRKELKRSVKILGISEVEILKYKDGEINNKQVWGSLELDLIDQIEKHKPEIVVTFDHSGWYFHLDHVAVSLASMRAVQRSNYRVEGLLFNLFHPPGIKTRWDYVYQEKLPITHEVDIAEVVDKKIAAIKAHGSQHIPFIKHLEKGVMNKEYFQLVVATKRGEMWFNKHKIFRRI